MLFLPPQIPPRPSRRTVSRILVESGYRSLRSKKKPLLTRTHRLKRMDFAKKFANYPWKGVIFSDEKIFRVRPGARVRCWVAPNDSRFLPKYLTSSVQKPEGVMVWAAMKSSGAICLRRCPPKMNAAAYQGILASAKSFIKPRFVSSNILAVFNLFPLHRGGGWKFQQDGASPHRALTTQAWLRRNKIPLLNRGFWPPMSPDMNPIEHLWPMVLKKLNGGIFSGREQLWASLLEAFAAISPDQVDRLYHSMPNRMAAVRAARGGATRY